jgi:hypothetical protein
MAPSLMERGWKLACITVSKRPILSGRTHLSNVFLVCDKDAGVIEVQGHAMWSRGARTCNVVYVAEGNDMLSRVCRAASSCNAGNDIDL